ncbi:MAG: TolC family protein [Chitinophagaceae bacterium]
MQLRLQQLLHTKNAYLPIVSDQNLSITTSIIDSVALQNHPVILQTKQEQAIAIANTQNASAQLLPTFTVGINNTSIRGIGADDKSYAGSYRFQSVQVGTSIPVFNKSQKVKVKAAKIAEQIANNNYHVQLQQLVTAQQTAALQVQQQEKALAVYLKDLLPNADTIFATAQLQLYNGVINYLEWVQLIHQVISIRSEYINTIYKKNKAIVQLHYFDKQ